MGASFSDGVLVEGIALTLESALGLIAAGVGRLELCAALELGGLTPSLGLVRAVALLEFPFVAMVRPRASGFCYSESEFESMLADVEFMAQNGASGVVVGFITQDRQIDVNRTHKVVQAAHGKDVVFNRAFDATRDPLRSLQDLIEAGVTRVLTTGHAKTALEGVGTLKKMVDYSDGRIEILAGGGVRASNAVQIVEASGVRQVHLGPVNQFADPSVTDNVPYDPTFPVANLDEVRRTCELLSSIHPRS